MAFDERLAARIRKVLAGQPGVAEIRMFGGLCFTLHGNMVCGVAGEELMLRVGPERQAQALGRPHARAMDFTGRPMKGFVTVAPAGLATARDLRRWIDLGRDFVAGLPPKTSRRTSPPEKKPAAPGIGAGRRRAAPGFTGFPPQTLRFLADLESHNHKAWFEAHRDDYQRFYVAPALAFVETLGPRLKPVSRTLNYAARINGSLFRVNRDVRFGQDKTPYKAHIDLWFWEGEQRGWDTPGLFLRLAPGRLTLGAGVHRFGKAALAPYREAVLDKRRGPRLVRILDQITAAGPYAIGGETRNNVPRGYDAGHPRAELLKHDGLFASLEQPPPPELAEAGFTDWCLAHYRALAPLHRWLLALASERSETPA